MSKNKNEVSNVDTANLKLVTVIAFGNSFRLLFDELPENIGNSDQTPNWLKDNEEPSLDNFIEETFKQKVLYENPISVLNDNIFSKVYIDFMLPIDILASFPSEKVLKDFNKPSRIIKARKLPLITIQFNPGSAKLYRDSFYTTDKCLKHIYWLMAADASVSKIYFGDSFISVKELIDNHNGSASIVRIKMGNELDETGIRFQEE